ncbi:SDR family NAD(P)-dependent oxidoreductase [Arvimicrobium flavum]|uniref:SDR family NAD(P)-dependent oxidoreductase n=1 Tax=Arvimicrobium flavum TaxID=3393320 RepID=UPI00237B2C55|nr:SDR family NAD(P)-dependent oxidoreductase [Mesorhizobium shangrilense]
MLLKDRVAVITGAGMGIGRAVAEAYAREGAKVAIVERDESSGAAAAEQLKAAGHEAAFVACDVADRESVLAAAQTVRSTLGPIEILVNNAGITRPAMLHKMTVEQWNQVIDVHLHGSFHWLQAVVEEMIAAQWGRIIFTSSSTAQNGSVGQINYSAAKSAVLGMTRTAARELGKHNILVNAVAPSAPTDMTKTVMEDPKFAEMRAVQKKLHPLRRSPELEEVARPYVFLASEMSSYVTGQIVSIDGGSMLVR